MSRVSKSRLIEAVGVMEAAGRPVREPACSPREGRGRRSWYVPMEHTPDPRDWRWRRSCGDGGGPGVFGPVARHDRGAPVGNAIVAFARDTASIKSGCASIITAVLTIAERLHR
jgi:hypothetical protein